MSLTEFNEEEFKHDMLEEGREEKAIEATINLLKMNVITPEQISQAEGLPLAKVLELQSEYCK